MPIGDAGAFATAVIEAASARAETERRGAAAFEDVLARYTPAAVEHQLIDALETLNTARRQSRRSWRNLFPELRTTED